MINNNVEIFRVTAEHINDEFTQKLRQSFPPDEDTQNWDTEKIREFTRNSKNIFIVAMIDRNIAGFVFGWEIPRMERSKQFYIDEVATFEKYQHQGIAKMMLEFLNNILGENGFDLIYVLTEEVNIPANRLYNSLDANVEVEGGVVMYTYKFD